MAILVLLDDLHGVNPNGYCYRNSFSEIYFTYPPTKITRIGTAPPRSVNWYPMLRQFVKGRVYVFIDAENLFYAQRTLGWRISYERFIKYFKRECGGDTKCFVYSGKDEHNTKQQKFLDMLEISGYIVRTKVVKKIRDHEGGYKWKSNLDIELAFEMDDTKNKYDTAILVSGDSDFATPIDRVKKAGKHIIVMSTRGHISKELLERAKYIDLRKLSQEIAQK